MRNCGELLVLDACVSFNGTISVLLPYMLFAGFRLLDVLLGISMYVETLSIFVSRYIIVVKLVARQARAGGCRPTALLFLCVASREPVELTVPLFLSGVGYLPAGLVVEKFACAAFWPLRPLSFVCIVRRVFVFVPLASHLLSSPHHIVSTFLACDVVCICQSVSVWCLAVS